MNFIRDVENNSVSVRLRKAYRDADLSSHTVLTDDVFQYVDFFFKTHKKNIKNSSGKKIDQHYLFYWQQSKNFYNATKMLPIESSSLPMYYCMLNAVKAYLLYNANNYDELKGELSKHGLKEGNTDSDEHPLCLDSIYVRRDMRGVFSAFSKKIQGDFDTLWSSGKSSAISLKQLMYQIPFVHSAYISTYRTPRKNEKFIPLFPNQSPRFMYSRDRKIRLVVDLDRHYFKQNATTIPDEVKTAFPDELLVNESNAFQLVSRDSYAKREIACKYNELRDMFSYIKADRRIWYLKKKPLNSSDIDNINSMSLEIAIVHRFSEIVRYKPEQMVKLLAGKENWLIHEFLSLALDQFMDEIACEITKQEIMSTRIK